MEDPDGVDLDDAAAARREALRITRSLWGEMLFRGLDPTHCAIVIIDEAGRTIEAVPFAKAGGPGSLS